jgi:hypothetical protein
MYTLRYQEQSFIMNHSSKIHLKPSKYDTKEYRLLFSIFIGGRDFNNYSTIVHSGSLRMEKKKESSKTFNPNFKNKPLFTHRRNLCTIELCIE